jgi:UDP-GlcNAc:undecaprenyl-phosphate GlcNAc-1-phosphate transferase
LFALLLSFVFTWVVRNRALKYGWVSLPESERHIHTTPLPRIGGVAIYAALVIALLAAIYYMHLFPVRQTFHLRTMLFLLVPGTLVFLLGLYDDIRGIGPYWKFLVQAIAAGIVFAGGLRIVKLPLLFGSSQFSWVVSLAITIFWILWITNAFNLIDGVDGLATGSALFATFVVLIVSALNGNQFGLLLTATLSGALIGFLRYNFNPATIFLGDCGSLFVGFMLGSLALHGSQKSPTMVAVAIPVVSFGLPILETVISVFRRFMNGKPLFVGDREHIHHKLLKRGLSPRQTTLILYAVSAVFGLLSLVLLLPGGGPVALVLIVFGGMVWVGVQHLGYHELVELRRMAQRTLDQKHVIINNLSVRRAITEFAGCSTLEQVRAVLERGFADNEFDGYELEYALTPVAGAPRKVHMAWCKPEAIGVLRLPGVWRMELPLGSAIIGRGHFRVYRRYSDRPLMLDINLLTRFFPGELTQALERGSSEQSASEKTLRAAASASAPPLQAFGSGA